MNKREFPKRVVCLTEESVEVLFHLGLQDRIVGVSSFVKRPLEAQKLPKVSVFTHGNLEKIYATNPDLILGFSDIQKDIAKECIGMGLNVFISNHRTIDEILDYILMIGSLFGKREEAFIYIDELEEKIKKCRLKAEKRKKKVRVYLEEWDSPMISGIKWFSEVVELCGGENIFKEKSNGVLAKDRFVNEKEVIEKNPEIIFACWCGKKVDKESIKKRTGWENISAVKNSQIYELEPEIFLQPGPAPIVDGLSIIESHLGSLK